MVTRIVDLSDLTDNIDDFFLTEENLSRAIFDTALSLEIRIKAINIYYQKEGGDNTIEIINKLATMYEMSRTKLLQQYLFAICEKSSIEPFLLSLAARALYNEKDDLGYKAIDIVYPKLGSDIGTPYKIDFIRMLLTGNKYKEKAKTYFCQIINDNKLDCDYRYKAILSLENEKKLPCLIKEANLCFLKNNINKIPYRILSGQYLLQKCDITQERKDIEEILLHFSQDGMLDYNLRADSTDVLLHLGSDKTKKIARDIITKLGKNNFIFYDNTQNVHSKEVEESVLDALEFLQTFQIMTHEGKAITVDFVRKKIEEISKDEKIHVSFNRIIMDRALYSKYNCTLSHILLQVWTYLSGHKSEEEIKKRLVEELTEMSGTCSSGFASRIINTISGFEDFSLKISWQDQIIANLTGRLNARIRDMNNLTVQEKILEEMTIPSEDYSLRANFLEFFRKNVSSIREEMYREFKGYITDTDYDLYFRAAISIYETGSF